MEGENIVHSFLSRREAQIHNEDGEKRGSDQQEASAASHKKAKENRDSLAQRVVEMKEAGEILAPRDLEELRYLGANMKEMKLFPAAQGTAPGPEEAEAMFSAILERLSEINKELQDGSTLLENGEEATKMDMVKRGVGQLVDTMLWVEGVAGGQYKVDGVVSVPDEQFHLHHSNTMMKSELPENTDQRFFKDEADKNKQLEEKKFDMAVRIKMLFRQLGFEEAGK